MSEHLHAVTTTYLFTDIEGSTRLWEQHPEAMKSALGRHDALLRQAIESQGGSVVKTTGDGCLAAFPSVQGALQATLAAQQVIEADGWVELQPQTLRVRMALHTGEAELRAGDYFGTTINRAARLMSIGHGGQVLLSDSTASLARQGLPEGAGLLDLGEHRLKDLSSSEHVYQLKYPGLQADFPTLKSLELRQGQAGEYAGEYAYPNNLPAQLTSFVGRQRELAETKELQASARLLTLIGPGGTGKTRLAVQLGADLLPEYPDGAWLVELAPVSDPELVLQSVAAVLNLRERPGITLPELVISYLQVKRLLLILDNCEHLIEACARLADLLLRHCPGLKMIASSREALGIAGERIYSVPSLGLPAPKTGEDPEDLARSEAVQLFVERAAAVQPRFSLNEQNAAFVAQICRRLDGIPLAIELAAARARLLSPEQIAARLDDRFRLLTGGSRAALPRQQTLQALIDWSYDLLPEAERGLLRRLAVFAGGWSLEAAEAIYPDVDVLDLLAQLANKSLVVVEETQAGPMRYRLLETIRQYGLERLLEAGETIQARDRHQDYFLRAAEDGEQDFYSPRENLHLDACELEHDNFRAALQWSLERNPEAALRLAGALEPFWARRGYNLEGYHWLQQVLERADALPADQISPAARAKALMGLGGALIGQGLNTQAISVYKEVEDMYREWGNPADLGFVLGMLGFAYALAGEFELGKQKMAEAIALGRQTGNKLMLAMSLGVYGNFTLMSGGDLAEGRRATLEGNRYAREIGAQWVIAQSSLGLGRLAAYEGQPEQARRNFLEAEAIYQEMGERFFVNVARSEQAHLERHMGNLEAAMCLYRECLPVWVELGHKGGAAHELECIAFIDRAWGQPEQVARLLGAAQALRETIGSRMNPDEHEEYESELAALKNELDQGAYQAAWSAGRQMNLTQAVACALDESTCI